MIRRMVPSARLVALGSNGDARNYRVSFGKISNQLGFVPQWSLERGLRQVLDAVQSGKVGDYRDAKYSNVKFLSGEGMTLLPPPEHGWAYELLKDSSQMVAAMAQAVESGELDAREALETRTPKSRPRVKRDQDLARAG
jgi:hypothetical protein